MNRHASWIESRRQDGWTSHSRHRGLHCSLVASSTEPIPGGLVHVPDDAERAERVARHQLAKFLLRQGRIDPGKTSWNEAHKGRVAEQVLTEPARKRLLADNLAAVEQATARVDQPTEGLGELSASRSPAPLVTALQAMRGIEMVGAVALVAEVGDFKRFAKAGDLMALVGLVPLEHSGGGPSPGPGHPDGQCSCPAGPGGVGLARPAAASAEQGDPSPRRGGVGRGEADRVEGGVAAGRADEQAPGARETAGSGGDRGGPGAGGLRPGDLAGGGAPGRLRDVS